MPEIGQHQDVLFLAIEGLMAQTPPLTPPPPQVPPKSSRRTSNTFSTLRRSFSTAFHRSPEPLPADPINNMCGHCKNNGHWSNECPVLCTICAQQKGKEARGHEPKDCSPICSTCNGIGLIKRRHGDVRTRETLTLEASLAAVKQSALDMRNEIMGSISCLTEEDRIRNDLHANLDHLVMRANMALRKMEELGDLRTSSGSGGGFRIELLDPYHDEHNHYPG